MVTTEERADKAPFDPTKHLIDPRKDGRLYLETKWRLVWLREQQPNASVETTIISSDDKGITIQAVVSWPVTLSDGSIHIVRGTGTAHEPWVRKGRYGEATENAETSALGRALATLGFGTQYAPEFDEQPDAKPADSPVQSRQRREPAAQGAPAAGPSEDWAVRYQATADNRDGLVTLANDMVKAKVPAGDAVFVQVKTRMKELASR